MIRAGEAKIQWSGVYHTFSGYDIFNLTKLDWVFVFVAYLESDLFLKLVCAGM